MRLLFLSLYFHPAFRYGGPVASTWELTRGLASRGIEVRVATTDAHGTERLAVPGGWQELAHGLSVRYFRRLGGERIAPGLALALPRCIARADLVHVSGLMVWALPEVLFLCRLLGRPLVVSPRGMLLPQAVAAKAWKKGPFLALLRLLGLSRAVLHATSEEEVETCAGHFPGARVRRIPNGVAVPEEGELAALRRNRPPFSPYLLYLGRLHPHKEIAGVLAAFAGATGGSPPAPGAEAPRLVIAGDGEAAYRESLKARAAELGLGPRVLFSGQVSGEEKGRLLAGAEGLVLASRSENFGMSVAEALAHGTPAVVARSAPWQGLEEHGCGFWVEGSTAGVAEGLRRLLALAPAERRALGERGRSWMQRDLAWDRIAARMEELYREILPASTRAER